MTAATMNRRVRDVHAFLAKSPAAIRVEGFSRTNLPAGTPALCYYTPVGASAHSYASNPSMAIVGGPSGTFLDGVKAPVDGRYKLSIGGAVTAVTAQAAARVCYLQAAVNAAATDTAVGVGAFLTFPLTNLSTTVHQGAMSTEVVLRTADTVRVACRMDGSAYNWASGSDAGFTQGSFIELRWIGEVPT
ncbi:hypothetical protein [Streptomyces sp. H39-S7]|uniref:hypothetical protein n=1 Tax=Streptomyces sp. H39-S7 TaxID=3004357 RepID=UPI0022AF0846|nr:hypothetical protein [Streptomyces sp. H39-S7]MCZ4119046.1 hypothetical protein [Streptomyces sp. H39-S7]